MFLLESLAFTVLRIDKKCGRESIFKSYPIINFEKVRSAYIKYFLFICL